MAPEERFEKLTRKEKELLFKRMFVSIVFGAIFMTILTYIIFIFNNTNHLLPDLISSIFFGFFTLVLLFIIGVHVVNYFSGTKKILTGIITKKEEKVMTMSRNTSGVSPTYYVTIGDKEMMVDVYLSKSVCWSKSGTAYGIAYQECDRSNCPEQSCLCRGAQQAVFTGE